MKMAKCEGDLREVELGHGLEKVALPLHEHEQLATLAVLKDKIQLSVRLEGVSKLDDKWMRHLL